MLVNSVCYVSGECLNPWHFYHFNLYAPPPTHLMNIVQDIENKDYKSPLAQYAHEQNKIKGNENVIKK